MSVLSLLLSSIISITSSFSVSIILASSFFIGVSSFFSSIIGVFIEELFLFSFSS
ncbi:hypothetical protein HOG21_07975 [bacterium]|nr:hypothetical protein [bacterium]